MATGGRVSPSLTPIAGPSLSAVFLTTCVRRRRRSLPPLCPPGSPPAWRREGDAVKPAPENCIIAHTDGGARGNPGPAGYGVVIHDSKGSRIAGLSKYVGRQTNNFAEYQALIGALEYAIEHHHKALKVVSDSELMVRQIKGIYKVKEPTLRDLYARATELISKLDWFQIEHVLRGHNREADQLANEAMD